MRNMSGGNGAENYIDHQYAFTARMDNVKILSQLLKCISFRCCSQPVIIVVVMWILLQGLLHLVHLQQWN